MLVEIFELILASLILVSVTLYMWKNIYNDNRISYLTLASITKFVICCTILILNQLYIHNFLQPIISTMDIVLLHYSLYKSNIKNNILVPIYSQIVVIISEFICIILILLISQASDSIFKEQYFESIISNALVAIICILLVKTKVVSKTYKIISKFTDKISENSLIFISIIFIIVASLLTSYVYYKVSLIYLLIINAIVIIVYTIFVFFYLKTNNNYIKVYDKYTNTLNSLKEYEDILSRYRISNHENKNQLLTIRGMVKNKKVASYIDEIVENKIKDDEKLMFESLIIPEGGLRGLIYSKLLLMKENNIEYDLCIDKKIKTTELTKLDDELVLSICNIVGVYLDNAIEEVKHLDERYIIIEMYKDETLNIAITNNYVGNIDIDSMDNVGYSTKGKGHGYGLSLVKQILENNKKIKSFRRISEDEFTQEIKIKCQ